MTNDRYQHLRDALNAGPTPGPWRHEAWGSRILDSGVGSRQLLITTVAANTFRDQGRHNANYIAAASPGVVAALLNERDRLREALTFVRRGIESGHIEFSPIVLDKSGCFKQEHRRLTDVVNAALGDTNAHP